MKMNMKCYAVQCSAKTTTTTTKNISSLSCVCLHL